MKKRLLMIICAAFIAAPATAANLQNKDNASYKLTITSKGGTTSSTIHPTSVRQSICYACTIDVKGVGKVTVTDANTAVIKNGKISLQ
ncbi:MAG: hypothetical protein Q9M31_00125 [Mariprofundus sp.]|nr:hypothetical protein [Mariprofundus sp.]